MDSIMILCYYDIRFISDTYDLLIKALQPGISSWWEDWKSLDDPSRCIDCKNLTGQIQPIGSQWVNYPPLHYNCRCSIQPMLTLAVGTVTDRGTDGADWYLKFVNTLPDYYISKLTAILNGWDSSKNSTTLDKVIPDKMIGGDEYKNKDGHLPSAPGRKWYEADIDYSKGKRNGHRLLYSSDGLMFATYDHYKTFYEII